MSGKKVGIVLSGCGVYDGSEIHEATLTLLHVVSDGATPVFMAPDVDQQAVINHLNHQPMGGEPRNVLTEAARIARGDIKPMFDIRAEDLDALIFPGGFGAARNLSDFAANDNPDRMVVELHVQKLVEDMFRAGKPMGFICIAPASVAAVALKGKGLTLTIGNDTFTAETIEKLGHTHKEAKVDEIVIDKTFNIVSTPAYMLANNIAEANAGISKLVAAVLDRVKH